MFFLGAGEVDLKVGFSAADFIKAYKVWAKGGWQNPVRTAGGWGYACSDVADSFGDGACSLVDSLRGTWSSCAAYAN